jgi:hypothetical protein
MAHSVKASAGSGLVRAQLSWRSLAAIAAGAIAVTAVLVAVTPLHGLVGSVLVAAALYIVAQTAVSGLVEGHRAAINRQCRSVSSSRSISWNTALAV